MSKERTGVTNLPFIEGAVLDRVAAADVTVGGRVIRATAAAALNVGDLVFWSAAGKVNKSATPANYQAMAGVVVGGKNTDMDAVTDWAAATPIVATTADNDEVLIQISGIVFVISDAGIAAGAWVGPPATTAGRVDDGANAVAGQRLGRAIKSAGGAAEKVPVQIIMS